MTTPEPIYTVEDRAKERAAEYAYVALVPIDIDGARAFNPGHLVPAGHVADGKVRDDQVAKRSTKSGQQAVAAVTDTSKG